MYLCYIDESGTSSLPGNTSQFVLSGLSIPITHWKDCDQQVSRIKAVYGLSESEIHTAWMLRPYLEQTRIPDFEGLDWNERRSAVERLRREELLRLQKERRSGSYKQTRKNYEKSTAYVHLTFVERKSLVEDLARCISNWGYARLFAECIDKVHFDPLRNPTGIDEQAFQQIVSRFERFLEKMGSSGKQAYGLIIHDNNETVARKHTLLMKAFHQQGTLWTKVKNIIETPFFVDSALTSMVQIADLCSYALRRYLENAESDLFDMIFARADRVGSTVVGVRHFTDSKCTCKICQAHRLT